MGRGVAVGVGGLNGCNGETSAEQRALQAKEQRHVTLAGPGQGSAAPGRATTLLVLRSAASALSSASMQISWARRSISLCCAPA